MIYREYQPSDCKELAELFYNTVHTVNAKDYTQEQLNVWAQGCADLGNWNRSLLKNYCVVAVNEGFMVGFGDIDKSGYIDKLFVHKDYQGKGIATAICNRLERIAKGKILTCASVTAKPFFEKRGYIVVKEQQIERQGIYLANFLMKKENLVKENIPTSKI